MNKRASLNLFFILLLSVSFAASPKAQTPQGAYGREFYVAFGPNEGGEISPTLDADEIYISSPFTAHGTIEVPALSFVQTFSVVPGQVTTIELPNGNSNSSTVELPDSLDEQVLPGRAVHITSDTGIAVFGLNHKEYSSDAFMALPNTVLGTEYRTLNYQTSNSQGDVLPGQFWMIAISDSTHVTITLKNISSLGNPAGIPIAIVLNRGDCYLVQGALDTVDDLTGSHIVSDKPIAVFSGHKRTAIPDTAVSIDGTASRDHLVEELEPVAAWGNNAIVVPFATSTLPDLVRVVFAEDGTKISIDGNVPETYNAGDFYEITHLSGATSIETSEPIEVGQYMHTSWGGLDDPVLPAYGDPALTMVLPVEQFAMNYTIISIQKADAFTANFVNIVANASTLGTILLDGTPLDDAEFHAVPNSTFLYAQHPISQGAHTLSSSQPFGVTVYALGPVDSYAYPGAAIIPVTFDAHSSVASSDATNFSIQSVWPNPVLFSRNEDVSLHYTTQQTIRILCTVWDELGRKTGSITLSLTAPAGDVHIPRSLFPQTGTATIEVEELDRMSFPQRIRVEIN